MLAGGHDCDNGTQIHSQIHLLKGFLGTLTGQHERTDDSAPLSRSQNYLLVDCTMTVPLDKNVMAYSLELQIYFFWILGILIES